MVSPPRARILVVGNEELGGPSDTLRRNQVLTGLTNGAYREKRPTIAFEVILLENPPQTEVWGAEIWTIPLGLA